jgi:hypothetical protein
MYHTQILSLLSTLTELANSTHPPTDCLHADFLGQWLIATLTLSVFQDIQTVLTLPPGFLFVAEAVVQKFSAQFLMVLILEHSVSPSIKMLPSSLLYYTHCF